MIRISKRIFCQTTRRLLANNSNQYFKHLSTGYKSQYSIDNIYINSNPDFLSGVSQAMILMKLGRGILIPCFQRKTQLSKFYSVNNNEEFSGFIPIDQVDISYSRSSGPGGQNVNKVNTKVEIRFHVESAEWIPQWIREKLIEKEQNNINKDGYLILTSDRTRKQMLNQADCLDKLRTIIFNASQKPYEPTVEEIAVKNKRIAKSQSETLKKKRQHSLKKENRRAPTFSDS